jgi:hypothetical protein
MSEELTTGTIHDPTKLAAITIVVIVTWLSQLENMLKAKSR